MAETHLQCPPAAGQPHELMTQADPESGYAVFDEPGRRDDGVVVRLRVTRSIGQKYPIRSERQDIVGGRLRRQYRDPAGAFGQHPQDVALDTEVEGHHMIGGGGLVTVAGPSVTHIELPCSL